MEGRNKERKREGKLMFDALMLIRKG
jgi:hypothetical protein